MEIEKLILVFEKLLPIYQKAYNENWSLLVMSSKYIDCGLCKASLHCTEYDLYDAGVFGGYYKRFVKNYKLFEYPHIGKDLKNRIDFMKSEIKDLKRLIKKGYTHV